MFTRIYLRRTRWPYWMEATIRERFLLYCYFFRIKAKDDDDDKLRGHHPSLWRNKGRDFAPKAKQYFPMRTNFREKKEAERGFRFPFFSMPNTRRINGRDEEEEEVLICTRYRSAFELAYVRACAYIHSNDAGFRGSSKSLKVNADQFPLPTAFNTHSMPFIMVFSSRSSYSRLLPSPCSSSCGMFFIFLVRYH